MGTWLIRESIDFFLLQKTAMLGGRDEEDEDDIEEEVHK